MIYNKKYHYVYQITYSDTKKYIGVRSCNCEIEDDSYMGSAYHLPKEIASTGVKEVLSTHTTREEAMLEEIRLHALYNVKDNPEYYNQCNATSTKFLVSEEGCKRSGEAKKGRTKETHEYIQKQVEARSKYKGEGLTEAQKAQWSTEKLPIRKAKRQETLRRNMLDPEFAERITEARRRGGKSMTGVPNPKKGSIGAKHPKFKPWEYKTPETDWVQVHDSIRNYFNNNANTFTITRMKLTNILRNGKVPNELKELGWDFRYIDKSE